MEWFASSLGRGNFPTRGLNPHLYVSCIAGRFFTVCSIAGLYSMLDSDKYYGGKNTMKVEDMNSWERG